MPKKKRVQPTASDRDLTMESFRKEWEDLEKEDLEKEAKAKEDAKTKNK